MTRPQYNPFIKKASGIITDEGGMLCHAAILAREQNIPCIVGTKNATEIIRNKMRVRMQARKGIIELL